MVLLGCFGEFEDVVNVCVFFVFEFVSWVIGVEIVVDGGVLVCFIW